MIYPAMGVHHLDLSPGRYVLAISHRDTTDTYGLDVTDTSIATTGTGSVSAPTARFAWRYPRNSFAVGCNATDDAARICDDAIRMLSLEPGITPMSLPPAGRNPYGQGGIHFHIDSPHLYRYARRADL